MRKIAVLISFFIVLLLSVPSFASAPGDTLASVQQRGVLAAGVITSMPPFSYLDEKSNEIVGYDIDFLKAIAKKLGVKVELKPVNSENRIPLLKNRDIDIAILSRTTERDKEIDFSFTYFFAIQKLLAKKGSIKNIKDLSKKKIATAKGSTAELELRKAIPEAEVVLFEKYPEAFKALQDGKVQAMTADESILAGLLSHVADKNKYEISRLQIALKQYAIGIRNGDSKFLDFINKTLIDMEKSGEARKIFEKWFGAKSEFHMRRTFKIHAGM